MEGMNGDLREFQSNNSRQDNPLNRNKDTFLRAIHRSCPELHRYLDRNSRNRRNANDIFDKSQIPLEVWVEVKKLCRNNNKED